MRRLLKVLLEKDMSLGQPYERVLIYTRKTTSTPRGSRIQYRVKRLIEDHTIFHFYAFDEHQSHHHKAHSRSTTQTII